MALRYFESFGSFQADSENLGCDNCSCGPMGVWCSFFAEPSPKFKRQLCKLPRTGWAAVQDKDRREQNQDLLTAIALISSLSVVVELAQY